MFKYFRFLLLLVLSSAFALYAPREVKYLTKTATPVPRTLILKLPIDPARLHWIFTDRTKLLAGKLTLGITRKNTTQIFTIFENGKMNEGWTSVNLPNPNEIYFGFFSRTPQKTAPGDKLTLTLVLPENVPGKDPFISAILPKGTYTSSGIYTQLTDTVYKAADPKAKVANNKAYLTKWSPQWDVIDTNPKGGWLTPEEREKLQKSIEKL